MGMIEAGGYTQQPSSKRWGGVGPEASRYGSL